MDLDYYYFFTQGIRNYFFLPRELDHWLLLYFRDRTSFTLISLAYVLHVEKFLISEKDRQTIEETFDSLLICRILPDYNISRHET